MIKLKQLKKLRLLHYITISSNLFTYYS